MASHPRLVRLRIRGLRFATGLHVRRIFEAPCERVWLVARSRLGGFRPGGTLGGGLLPGPWLFVGPLPGAPDHPPLPDYFRPCLRIAFEIIASYLASIRDFHHPGNRWERNRASRFYEGDIHLV